MSTTATKTAATPATRDIFEPPVKKRRSPDREWGPAHYIRRLAEAEGNHEVVAELIGVSGSAISKAVRENRATRVMEKAAEGVWFRKHAPKGNKTAVAIIMASPDTITYIRSLLSREGGSLTLVEPQP